MEHISLAAGLLAVLAALASCKGEDPLAPNKRNPAVEAFPAADFGLRVLDFEQGGDPDSCYVFKGLWRDGNFCFGLDKLDPMTLNLSGDNALVLEILPLGEGFRGVNAASSARCIDIVAEGGERTRFRLERVTEGESTIVLWNGGDGDRRELSFPVTSREEIPVEGFRCRVDGQLFDIPMIESGSFLEPNANYHTRSGVLRDVKAFPGWDRMQVLELVGPVPLNATGRKQESIWLYDPVAPAFPLLDDEGNCFTGDWPSFVGPEGIADINRRHYPAWRWFAPDRYAVRFADDQPHLRPADMRERRMLSWKIRSSDDYGPRGDYGVMELGIIVVPRQETSGDYDWPLAKEQGAKYYRIRLQ